MILLESHSTCISENAEWLSQPLWTHSLLCHLHPIMTRLFTTPTYKRDLYEYQDVVFLLKIMLFNFLWSASYMCNYLKTFFISFCLWVFTLKYKNKVLFPREGCVMLGIALKPFLSFIFCDFVENSCVACHCGDLYWSLLKFKKMRKKIF